MTDPATAALVDAIEASSGLPIPTSSELAARIEQQLALRGYAIVGQPPVMCVCTGSGWPHAPSSERCTPPDGRPELIEDRLGYPPEVGDEAWKRAQAARADAPSPAGGDEEVPCALTSHHRGHRWVQLPGQWRTCLGVRITAPYRRNVHCSNCGDTRGGPVGHETSECTWDSTPSSSGPEGGSR